MRRPKRDWLATIARGGRVFAAFLMFALSAAANADSPALRPSPRPPSQLFDGLFDAVAASGLFSDFKKFADAEPREPPAKILAAYRTAAPKSKSALQRFVNAHFIFDEGAASETLPPQGLPIADHIARLWPVLTQHMPNTPPYSSLLALPEPYVVPGGRFKELYYWDSYFTQLGLGENERALRAGTIADFVSLIRTYGFIPNGNRSYYLSRSQPPFFFEMVALTDPDDPARAFARYLPELKAEHAYWMRGEETVSPGSAAGNVVRLPDGAALNRYWDDADTPRDEEYPKDAAVAAQSREPKSLLYRNIRAAAESGWDFSSRWLADGHSLATIETTAIIPCDLNALLYGMERAIEAGCEVARDSACAHEFATRADARRAAMNAYLWDAKTGAFYDYDWTAGKRRPVLSAATLYPLFTGEADDAQARAVAAVVRTRLLRPGGLATTENHTGQQWDAPNGWAPLQWIAVSGLRNYGARDLADEIATRWLRTVLHSYAASGRLVEKYDVDDPDRKGGGGEYPLQDGFGWTNGVTVALLHLCPRTAEHGDHRDCEAGARRR
jgi:alpha,alpha-trehalase